MSDIALRVENLSKAYRLTHQTGHARYKTLQEDLLAMPRRLGARLRGGNEQHELFWALDDVSFDVREGEVVGIIGRNGAGKSTLLKILSRITEPTRGRAEIYGRVGSLLEVGTGFHPELSGRENIFLSGAVLGMTRAEVQRKFDAIVAFAEVERFLDTPAKHYSSGMYVRLAFAVAAHLEPEILLVDEVLAVGDSEFQKKCLGKMGDVAKAGRTVLFVSHNMAAIQQLCQRGMVLSHGCVTFWGDAPSAIAHYAQNIQAVHSHSLAERQDRHGSQWLKFTRVAVCDNQGNEIKQVLTGQDLRLRFYYASGRTLQNANVNIAFNVRSPQGYLLTNLNSVDTANQRMDIYPTGYFECAWPHFNFRSGTYDCALFCEVQGEIVDWLQSAFTLQVEDGDFFGTGRLISRSQGDVLLPYQWSSHGSA